MAVLVVAATACGVLASCGDTSPGAASPSHPPGDASSGDEVIDRVGCGSCHVIPGIGDADGRVGPRLDGIAEQKVIAGRLPNSPENLARWIRQPQAVDPGVDMPDLGLTRREAQDVTAYLLEEGG